MTRHLSNRRRTSLGAGRVALLLISAGIMLCLPRSAARAHDIDGAPRAPSGWTLAVYDNFDDSSAALLPTAASDPTHYQLGYVNGEYRIAQIDPNFAFAPSAYLPSTYGDAMLSVDVRMVGDTPNRYISIICRRQPDGSRYEFLVDSSAGDSKLNRWDNGVETSVTDSVTSDAIHRGNQSNHIDLQCVGSTISAYVNGTQVLSTQDSAYQSGQWGMLASNYADSPLNVEARFKNLALYLPASATPTAAAPTPLVAPSAPANLQATALDSTSIRLDWTNSASNADEFRIYDGLTQTRIATAPSGASSFTLHNLTPGTSYCVYVYAYNAGGFSAPTNQACATTPS